MTEHYFSADPESAEHLRPVAATVWGLELALQSAAGVFAAGRLDIGTSVLFRESDPPTRSGTYLDLGCGYGVIACALAAAVPGADVWALDVNARALRLSAANADALGLQSRIHVTDPGGVPEDLRFDEIWSNPPIRIGKQGLHELLLTWLPKLKTGGRAVLVVSKNLGADSLQKWLGVYGYPCTRLASAKGFRLFEVRRET